ncbi:hypothetical protein DFH06DRAFT_1326667 [Mycena polygramma]|nr:hypothetical protein DFH06DRAFT_1326667 [Mycena polygramma]
MSFGFASILALLPSPEPQGVPSPVLLERHKTTCRCLINILSDFLGAMVGGNYGGPPQPEDYHMVQAVKQAKSESW